MAKAASKSPAAEPIAPMRPKESLKSPESVREDSRLKRRSSPKLPSSALEAVFKLEAHGHAVAKIFGTLDAEAGRGGDAALKSEGVGLRRNAVGFDLGMLVEEAVVDDAAKRDFRGGGKARGKAENRKGGHGLLNMKNAPDGLSRSRRREQHWNVGLNSNASHSHCASVITNRGEWLPMTFPLESNCRSQTAMRPILIAGEGLPTIVLIENGNDVDA